MREVARFEQLADLAGEVGHQAPVGIAPR